MEGFLIIFFLIVPSSWSKLGKHKAEKEVNHLFLE